ncbi:MAG: hypothetical protein JKY15_05175 [Deltaproteobacteria bacterium]|nr:hypothetical protein [Deltaproteobacteria bacterium]
MDNLKEPEAGRGARSHAPEEQQSPIQDRKSFKEPVEDRFEEYKEREGDEDFAAQRSILSGIKSVFSRIKSVVSGVVDSIRGFGVDPKLVQRLTHNRPLDDDIGLRLRPLDLSDLTVDLKAVPPHEREKLVEQIQSLIGNREGREKLVEQIQSLIGNREGREQQLVSVTRILLRIPTDKRPKFIDHIQSLVGSREGSARDLFNLATNLGRIPIEQHSGVIEHIQRLVGTRERVATGISGLVYHLERINVEDRPNFIAQILVSVRNREGNAEDLSHFINALTPIWGPQRENALARLRPEMTIREAANVLYRAGGPAPGGGVFEVHRVASEQMGPIYRSIKDRLAGAELVSEEEAVRQLSNWIGTHDISPYVSAQGNETQEQVQAHARGLLQGLLQHVKWTSVMRMEFSGLQEGRRVSGSDLLRTVVTDILNTPEGEQRDTKISQFLMQGLMDAIKAYGDNSTLDNASCVAGIAERLILAFREGKQQVTARDLAAILQADKEFDALVNIGVRSDVEIPAAIKESLIHIPKEALKTALGDELKNVKQAARQKLVSAGHEQRLIDEAYQMVYQDAEIEDYQVENLWKALHPEPKGAA